MVFFLHAKLTDLPGYASGNVLRVARLLQLVDLSSNLAHPLHICADVDMGSTVVWQVSECLGTQCCGDRRLLARSGYPRDRTGRYPLPANGTPGRGARLPVVHRLLVFFLAVLFLYRLSTGWRGGRLRFHAGALR